MAPLLTVSGLSFSYPAALEPTIDNFGFTLARNEFVAIVGGSGVGKSTLLRSLAGLITPDHGLIELATKREAGRRRRSIVFQDGRLLPWRTLEANISFGLKGLKLNQTERLARVNDVLELTQLTPYRNRFPHQLSGGQAQRGGIARALSVRPDILLMDEPFSAVDAITRSSLQDELLRIWQASGGAVVFITHDIQEAVYLADQVIVLAGKPATVVLDKLITLTRSRDRSNPTLVAIAEEVAAAQ